VDVVHLLCALLDEAFAADRSLTARFPGSPAATGRRSAELVTFVKDRPGHDRRYAVDTAKIERELGFTPLESFETGLGKTVAWYLEHEAWWRGVMDGSYRDWVRRQYGEPAAAPAPPLD
jgi:dTDP-glucose 4,6-dehydratase